MAFLGWCLLALTVLRLDTCAAYESLNGSYISDTKRLHDYLMEGYMTSIRPVNHSDETVMVNLSLRLVAIEDLDERNQAFIFNGRLAQSWKDAGLVWNPKDFNNISSIQIPASELWYPDVTILNSKDVYFVSYSHHSVVITFDGLVSWYSPVKVETHCEVDLSDFPFDRHMCKVAFGSLSQSDLLINLTSPDLHGNNKKQSLEVHVADENHAWEHKLVTVERHEQRYGCCPHEAFPKIIYSFSLRRRSTYATHLFVGPSMILCIITPGVFLLPPGSAEKIMFGIGVLIADTLLLGELIDYIPTAHPNLPFIAKYLLVNIIMASLSLAISAIIIGFWIKSTSRISRPPAVFRLVVLDLLATLLCVKKDDFLPAEETSSVVAMEINPEGENVTESTSGVDPATEKRRHFMANHKRNAARCEWRQLAVVFDRLFFIIYCIILAIVTLSFARYL